MRQGITRLEDVAVNLHYNNGTGRVMNKQQNWNETRMDSGAIDEDWREGYTGEMRDRSVGLTRGDMKVGGQATESIRHMEPSSVEGGRSLAFVGGNEGRFTEDRRVGSLGGDENMGGAYSGGEIDERSMESSSYNGGRSWGGMVNTSDGRFGGQGSDDSRSMSTLGGEGLRGMSAVEGGRDRHVSTLGREVDRSWNAWSGGGGRGGGGGVGVKDNNSLRDFNESLTPTCTVFLDNVPHFVSVSDVSKSS